MVADGTGGHLIPALEVAGALARVGARVKVWYARRPQTAPLAAALAQEAAASGVEVEPVPVAATHALGRLWQIGTLWRRAERCCASFAPDVVVGFGGGVSAPVLLAARRRRIGCVLHEQNVMMGRANRWLARRVDRVALSFRDTEALPPRTDAVVTGMPVRRTIGEPSGTDGPFSRSPGQLTVLVLGGSQGARAVNRLLMDAAPLLMPKELAAWRILHVTGAADEAAVAAAYAGAGVTAWVQPFLTEMGPAYAAADVVVARAGASTVAELARCGKPAVLIPYPGAGGHQRANARAVEAAGGGVILEEAGATPERLLASLRRILSDERLRLMMGRQLRTLDTPDAAERIAEVILALAGSRGSAAPAAQPARALEREAAEARA